MKYERFAILHKVIRFILIIIPIVTMGWLTVKELAPSGKMEATYGMSRETPFISKLYLKDRVSEIQKTADGDYYRSFSAEPIYFDLKPNGAFEKVTVTVKYKNSGQTPLKMGGLINKKEWAFDWREMETSMGERQTQAEIFEFKNLAPEGQKYRFGFSAPNLSSGAVEISEIQALFERQPLTAKEVVNKILDAAAWRLNRIFNF